MREVITVDVTMDVIAVTQETTQAVAQTLAVVPVITQSLPALSTVADADTYYSID